MRRNPEGSLEREQLELDAGDVLAWLEVEDRAVGNYRLEVQLAIVEGRQLISDCILHSGERTILSRSAQEGLEALGHDVHATAGTTVDRILVSSDDPPYRDKITAARRVRRAITAHRDGPVRNQLSDDARDVLAWLEHKTGLEGTCTLIAHLPGCFSRKKRVCVVIVYSDGRKGLRARAENALRSLGWNVQFGPEVVSEQKVRTAGMSAHMRLKAISRIRAAQSDTKG